jgi:hypothetical protein
LPGETFIHWKTPPYHGAHPKKTLEQISEWLVFIDLQTFCEGDTL